MCRCGDPSTAVRPAPQRRFANEVAAATSERTGAATHAVAMTYLGHTALLLKGPISRRVYALSPGRPDVRVDPRDAAAFSASPLFDASPPAS